MIADTFRELGDLTVITGQPCPLWATDSIMMAGDSVLHACWDIGPEGCSNSLF